MKKLIISAVAFAALSGSALATNYFDSNDYNTGGTKTYSNAPVRTHRGSQNVDRFAAPATNGTSTWFYSQRLQEKNGFKNE